MRASPMSEFCGRGHRWTEANTYWRSYGGRICRKCASYRNLRLYWLKKLREATTMKEKVRVEKICKERGYL